jgi:hypothetical protein
VPALTSTGAAPNALRPCAPVAQGAAPKQGVPQSWIAGSASKSRGARASCWSDRSAIPCQGVGFGRRQEPARTRPDQRRDPVLGGRGVELGALPAVQ